MFPLTVIVYASDWLKKQQSVSLWAPLIAATHYQP